MEEKSKHNPLFLTIHIMACSLTKIQCVKKICITLLHSTQKCIPKLSKTIALIISVVFLPKWFLAVPTIIILS